MAGRRIVTDFTCPPIPTRSFDWTAYDDNLHPDGPQGHGETECQAVDDLMEQIEESGP